MGQLSTGRDVPDLELDEGRLQKASEGFRRLRRASSQFLPSLRRPVSSLFTGCAVVGFVCKHVHDPGAVSLRVLHVSFVVGAVSFVSQVRQIWASLGLAYRGSLAQKRQLGASEFLDSVL